MRAPDNSIPNPQPSSYDPIFFGRLFAVEERHFWFRTRNRIIGNLVRQITRGLQPGYHVLEAGCGTGNVLRVLDQVCTRGVVVGMDLFAEGLQYARRRTERPLVQGDIHAAPFSIHFDIVCLFDVLEHLPDDRQVLSDLARLLAPGGWLLLTVPAHASLWSYFDEAAHHCRRYSSDDLESKLTAAGYRIEFLTQYMASLFPLVWLGRRVASLRTPPGAAGAGRAALLTSRELRVTPLVNDVLLALLAPEVRLISRRRRLLIGTSLLVIARKPPC